jgi:uncharacterized membrane protein
MRAFQLAIFCLLLTGLPLFAQQNGQSSQNPSAQSGPDDDNPPVLKRRPPSDYPAPPDQTTQAPSAQTSPADDDAPVLKRRPANDHQGTSDQTAQTPISPAPQTPSQNQNAPVWGQRDSSPTRIPAATSVPASTQFQASLDETLSSKSSHSGDSFTATLNEPLRSSHGDVLIPSGAKLFGVVQDAESGKVFASVRGKGKLILRFNEIELTNGQRMRIQTTLLNVGTNKAKASANQEGEITSGTRASDTVKKVGIGAGAGTIAGLIFGSAMKGAAIGAIAGGGYAMANAGREVELPAHTTINLRLDQYLTLPQGTAQTHP